MADTDTKILFRHDITIIKSTYWTYNKSSS